MLLPTSQTLRLTILHILAVTPVIATVRIADAQQSYPDLQYQRWSGTMNVPDPVAISVDDQGRVFVTQTRRRKIQDLDIRANRGWIPSDLGFKTVADKRDFYRRELAIGGDDEKQKAHVNDVNEDGHHDWRDLTVISERIFRLSDSDSDGTADAITTYAQGFSTEVTGIAAGVMAIDGDVWATIAPDVWKLRDHNDDGVADSREVMASGFGLHIAYAGHDMHGLTMGPDGKVYWSIGDKGISVTTKSGKQIAFPNQGGVMRCNPDGSDFEVFAHGLRNVQEFAFDQYGNIFGVDNDADQPNERERFIAIVDSMDAGWRCNYQYRGEDYNPWTDEKLWRLPGDEHPAYIIPPIQHYMDGPAGFKFNPGTALGPAYKDFFFVTNAPRGIQYAFQVRPVGDSFEMIDAHEIGAGHAIVGLDFGPDGGLYGADWDGGYPLDQKGAVIRIDVDDEHRFSEREQVRQVLADGFANRDNQALEKLLAHADMRIRMGAQFELVRRRQTKRLANVLSHPESNQLARLHCVWGLGQLARQGIGVSLDSKVEIDAVAALIDALSINDWRIQAQAAKTLGESPLADSKPLIDLLNHPDLHVRMHAGLALARHPDPRATFLLLPQSALLAQNQHYLRHSISLALAACAPSEKLAKQTKNPSEMCRLSCVLALRHQRSELVANFLMDSSSWVATEAARSVHDDVSIKRALPALAKSLGETSHVGEAYIRRAINANFCLGTREAASRLLKYALNVENPNAMRVEACKAIGQWAAPPVLDRVEGRHRELPIEGRDIDRERVLNGLADLVATADTNVRVAAVVAARELNLQLPYLSLATLLKSNEVPESLRIQALNSIAGSGTANALDSVVAAANSPANELAVRGLEILADQFPQSALAVARQRFRESKSSRIKQTCIATFAKIGTKQSDTFLADIAAEVIDSPTVSEFSLDVFDALKERSSDSKPLAAMLERMNDQRTELARSMKLDSAPAMISFVYSAIGGDRISGEKIFQTDLRAQCTRCHRIGRKGSKIGPELTTISKQRDQEHLLRSIVHPSADIEKKYFTQAVLTDSGRVVRGVIKSENDEETIVIDSAGKEIHVPTEEIEDIMDSKISLMPDMTETLSPRQVRDLVAYLRSLK